MSFWRKKLLACKQVLCEKESIKGEKEEAADCSLAMKFTYYRDLQIVVHKTLSEVKVFIWNSLFQAFSYLGLSAKKLEKNPRCALTERLKETTF